MAGLDAQLTDAPSVTIRTPDHRVRVFISSTMGELAAERSVVSDVIRRLRLSPVLFELGARPHPPRALYRAYLEQSHIFVGLYWERYGWVAPDMGISGLEDEYRLCGDQPMLLYVKEPSPNRDERLAGLIDEMTERPEPPKLFSTPEQLAELVANDLALLLSARFGSPRAQPATASATTPMSVRQPPPLPPTPLVGRDGEVASTIDLLMRDDVRLVTLSGPGGIGKSRLAIEVATRLCGEFSGGVIYTRLASVTDPELVLPTIAAAAGVHTEGTRSSFDAVVEELVAKPTLLVLDSFEHLLVAAPLVTHLLESCPYLKVLVTSRAVLRLHGEWEHPVAPLSQTDAVRLFTERAVDARAGKPLAPSDTTAIAEICRRLEGLPLAIELAAARSRLLPPAALLQRLGNRLDMLTGGPADLPERQQTLRGTIDWSYDLLEPAERLLFARLSVFAGGWTLDSAEEVCAGGDVDDVLTLMSSLLERSLINVASEGSSDAPRFKMLEVLREYATERLVELEDPDGMAQRHAAFVSRLANDAEPHLRDRESRYWDGVLQSEMDNIRASVGWLLDHDMPAAADLIWALSIHLWTGDHLIEARRWIERVVAARAALDQRQQARLDFLLGATAYEQGDYDVAVEYLRLALDGFRATGDLREQGSALTMLGATHPHFGHDDEAATCLHDAIEILRDIDEPWSLSFALNTLTALVARDDVDAATVTAAEALHIAERIDNQRLVTQALMQLGYLSLLRGDLERSRRLLERSAKTALKLRFREALAYCLDALAAVAVREGDARRAAMALGSSTALMQSIGAHHWPLLRDAREAIVEATRRRLGDADFTAANEAGRTLSHAQMLAQALQAPAALLPPPTAATAAT